MFGMRKTKEQKEQEREEKEKAAKEKEKEEEKKKVTESTIKKPLDEKDEEKKKKAKEEKKERLKTDADYYLSTQGPYKEVDPKTRQSIISDDSDNDEEMATAFSDSAVRSKFVRKVYLILSIQLAFTTVVNIPFLMLDDVQEFIYDYPLIVFIALAVFVVPYFMLVCCESTRRKFPTNMILLFLMTLGMAGVCGYVTAKLDTEVVFYSFLLTVVVTLSITTLAIFCPFDFTSCQMIMCVVFVVLIIFALISAIIMILTQSRILNLIYAGICVILFSLFLMFDTQAIIGGRRVSLSPDEYILAAIQVYVDIVEIFLNFLELVGACTEND